MWGEAEDTLGQFVAYVADCLRRGHLGDLYPWLSTPAPLDVATLPWSRRHELYTGRSRAELAALVDSHDDDDLAGRLGLEAGAADPAGSPVTQALRDLPPGLSPEVGTVLRALDDATRSAHGATALERLREIARDAARETATPEEAGYAAARALRADVNLDGQPLPSDDLRDFLRWLDLDVRLEPYSASGARMLMGRREGARGVALVLESGRTRVQWGQRFEAVRALGHVLLDPTRQGVIGAASSHFAQEVRRRRSGAFAAELLLPESALQRETGGTLDACAKSDTFERLMQKFGVGARTAAHHLYNHQFLSSPEIRDQLIDEYAAA